MLIKDANQSRQQLLNKMMLVGGLAAGMANEINNPLAGILHSVQNILPILSLPIIIMASLQLNQNLKRKQNLLSNCQVRNK